MKKIIILLAGFILLLSACEKDNYIDTGKARGIYDGSMWEYFMNDEYRNWDSTMIAIEHAGLKHIFDGTDPEYRQITFFGITSLSMISYLLFTEFSDTQYNSIQEMPVELCREMILDYIISGRMMSNDFDFEEKGTLNGGTIVTTLSGKKLRVYRNTTTSQWGTPEKGAFELNIHNKASGAIGKIACSNIQTDNGVVHSMGYEFQWQELQHEQVEPVLHTEL